MAVKKVTLSDVSFKGDGAAMRAVWDAVTSTDTWAALSMPEYTARTLQLQGTFGSATVVLNGSVDGTNFAGLNNLAGSAISKTSNAISGVQDNVTQYQPSASGGDGTQTIVATMLFVGAKRYSGG